MNRNAPPREKRFPARVIENYAATGLPETLSFRAAEGGGSELLLYDEIGFWGITAADFVQALAAVPPGPMTLRINSPGGDAFDGIAIYNAVKSRGNVSVVIDGIAASAASFIAMAGDKVTAGENTFMMIHRASGVTIGNSVDHRAMADVLDKLDGQIAGMYAAKASKPADGFLEAMTAETYYTAQQAKDAGLVDEVAPNKTPAQDRAASAAADAYAAQIKTLTAQATDAMKSGLANLRDEIAAMRAEFGLTNAADAEWKCAAATNLPLDENASWDGPAAAERMLDAAGFNGDSPDSAAARRGFLAYDSANPKLKGSYKLPIADIIDGKLTAVADGVRNAASRLPQTDIPQDVKDKARGVLDDYEKQMSGDDANNVKRKAVAARKRRLRLAEAA